MIAAQAQPTVKSAKLAAASDEAEAVVARLEARLAELETEVAAGDPGRQELSLAAALGDADARTKLSELAMADAARDREIDTIRRAISEARRRCDVALTAVDQRLDRERLNAAIKVGAALVASAETIDRLLAELRLEVDNRNALASELIASGCLPHIHEIAVGDPSGERLNGAIRRANVHSLYTGHPHASGRSDAALATLDQAVVDRLQPPSAVAKLRRIF